MDSYIKSFDHVLFLGMAGNTLRINPAGENMGEDIPNRDAVVFVASDVFTTQAYRSSVRAGSPENEPRQVVADAVMATLAELHSHADSIHRDIMKTCSN